MLVLFLAHVLICTHHGITKTQWLRGGPAGCWLEGVSPLGTGLSLGIEGTLAQPGAAAIQSSLQWRLQQAGWHALLKAQHSIPSS